MRGHGFTCRAWKFLQQAIIDHDRDPGDQPDPGTRRAVRRRDRRTVVAANDADIANGNLAQSDRQRRRESFGVMMVTDHSAVNDKAKALACSSI
jgi:hypothetical protein